MTFKMKGSPFQRNFGIGSPLKKEEGTQEGDKLSVANWEKADEEYDEIKKAKGRDKLIKLQERYNTTFKKDEDGVFRNPDGLSPYELEQIRLEPTQQ